jgi:ribosomal protein L40E
MQCRRCHHENPTDAIFCQECGARLEVTCQRCEAPNQPSAKFCKRCGQPLEQVEARSGAARFASPEAYTPRHLAEKILTSRSALEGERKQVTVLFVDVSGFTALSERLDPEGVHELMTRAFDLMQELGRRSPLIPRGLPSELRLSGHERSGLGRGPITAREPFLQLADIRGERVAAALDVAAELRLDPIEPRGQLARDLVGEGA